MNGIAPTLTDERPRLVAFGGGKGGIGRSTLTAEISRALARRGHRVLCVDADWSSPTLNTLLHVSEPTPPDGSPPPLEQPNAHVADYITDTGIDDVWLVSFAIARQDPFSRPVFRPLELIRQMHELRFDWVLIDLPPGLDPLDVDLFVLSDIPVLVNSPEPAAVRVSTQFLRSAICRAIGYHPDTGDIAADLEETLEVQPLEADRTSLLEAAPSEPAKRLVRETFDRLETYLLVNLVREGAEKDLGHVLCHAWHRAIGLFPRFVNPVDYEDRRWFYHRRTSGANAVRGDETLSRDIEIVARSLSDIQTIDEKFPRPVPEDSDLHPALELGLSRETSPSQLRQFCRQLWEGYSREETVELIFSETQARQRVADNLQSLYRDVLTLDDDSGGEHAASAAVSGDYATPSSRPTLGEHSNPPAGSSTTGSTETATTPSSSHATPPTDTEEQTGNQNVDEPPTDGQMLDDDAKPSGLEFEADASVDENAPDSSSDNAPDKLREATGRKEQKRQEKQQEEKKEKEDKEKENSKDERSEESPAKMDRDGRSLDALDVTATQRPGRIVEQLRRSHQTSLHDLAVQTQIGAEYIAALEDGRLEDLPREVYTRGYLRQIARHFDADPDELVSRYFEHLDDPSDES